MNTGVKSAVTPHSTSGKPASGIATADVQFAPVPLLDVTRGNAPLMDEIFAALRATCDAGHFVGGQACQKFEASIADYCQAKHAIGCASGSDALLLALMAIDIQAGDEVIVPSFTFFATASCVTRLGATPVWVDIDPTTFNLDPECVRRAMTDRTKAIIPVHLFGQCAEMSALMEIGAEAGIHVIEDAAQAIGAEYSGRRAGSIGDMACISFYPTKNLGGFGDGGMLTTQDDGLADRLRLLANHGMRPRYYHSEVGINSRLDSIQAVALNIKLKHLDRWAAGRQANARRYDSWLRECGLGDAITLPTSEPHNTHVWNQYTIRIHGGRRDAVRQSLIDAGVGAEIYYPVPLHQQKCFTQYAPPAGALPHTEQAASEVLSLPIFAELTEGEQRRVVDQLVKAVRGND